jgi:hypothetical protein
VRLRAFGAVLLACGPSVTPPPDTPPVPIHGPIATVATPDAGGISPEPEPLPMQLDASVAPRMELAAGITSMRSRFRACYNRALMSDPTIQGGLVFDIAVGADGSVTSVVTKQNTLPLDVTMCLEKVVRTLLIDPPDASPVHVSVPIRFVQP